MLNKYISKYSNDKVVSAAQYITELICERKASKDKKDLHYRFWLSKEWSAFFKNQIATAHKLLKQYSDKAIVNALLTEQGKKIFSLRSKIILTGRLREPRVTISLISVPKPRPPFPFFASERLPPLSLRRILPLRLPLSTSAFCTSKQ